MEIDVRCQKCNAQLSAELTTKQRSWRTEVVLEVEPCAECLEAEAEKARKEAEG
jgi:hypothetical protein